MYYLGTFYYTQLTLLNQHVFFVGSVVLSADLATSLYNYALQTIQVGSLLAGARRILYLHSGDTL